MVVLKSLFILGVIFFLQLVEASKVQEELVGRFDYGGKKLQWTCALDIEMSCWEQFKSDWNKVQKIPGRAFELYEAVRGDSLEEIYGNVRTLEKDWKRAEEQDERNQTVQEVHEYLKEMEQMDLEEKCQDPFQLTTPECLDWNSH